MGGWLGALETVGKGILDSGTGYETGKSSQGDLLGKILNRYVPGIKTKPAGQQGQGASDYYSNAKGPMTSNYDTDVPGIDPAHLTDESNPMDPNRYEGTPNNTNAVEDPVGNQGQWASSSGNSSPAAGLIASAVLADGSTLVTKPTIAKIAEKGPEMVVPLNARAGNRVQPDVLEGHIQQPKVPGMRYNRYKAFTDRSY